MDELSGSVARSVAWVFPQNLGNLGARRVEFLASRSPPQENRKNEATCVTRGGADDGRRDEGREGGSHGGPFISYSTPFRGHPTF